MYIHFQQRAFHAFGVGNAAQFINRKALRNDVDDFIVIFNGHGLGVFHCQAHILLRNFFIQTGNIVGAVAGKGLQMRPAGGDKQAADIFI